MKEIPPEARLQANLIGMFSQLKSLLLRGLGWVELRSTKGDHLCLPPHEDSLMDRILLMDRKLEIPMSFLTPSFDKCSYRQRHLYN